MIALALLLLPQVQAWDTGSSSAAPYAADAIAARKGWTALGKAGAVKGDAVLGNGRVTLVARKGADGLEIHGPSGAVTVSTHGQVMDAVPVEVPQRRQSRAEIVAVGERGLGIRNVQQRALHPRDALSMLAGPHPRRRFNPLASYRQNHRW